MKAFVVTHYGPRGLQAADVPTPSVGPRDVLVDVRAASINPLDKMVRNGEFKQLIKYKRPFVLGHDLSGVITKVGPPNSSSPLSRPGDRPPVLRCSANTTSRPEFVTAT